MLFPAGAERIDALAKTSGISRSALYKAINAGELIARKHGGTTLILEEDWRAFLQSRPVLTPHSRPAKSEPAPPAAIQSPRRGRGGRAQASAA